MAKLVEIIGVAHNPNYPRRFLDPGEEDPTIREIRAGYEAGVTPRETAFSR